VPSSRTHTKSWRQRLSLVGVVVALSGAVAAAVIGRVTGAGWAAALGLGLLLGAGLYLWAHDEKKGWGDLGEGIAVSVVVAIALMSVQRDADERIREETVHRDEQLREADERQRKAAERDSLQLTLTLQESSRGIVLAERDLSGFFLANKDFRGADFHRANLTRADLRNADLRRINGVGSQFDGAKLHRANLRRGYFDAPQPRPASFRRAVLFQADLRGALLSGIDFTDSVLAGADLRNALLSSGLFRRADLGGANLAGALLENADLREADLSAARLCRADLKGARFEGARFDATTRWPAGFDPKEHGLRKTSSYKAWYAPC
jgi:uncharacterized protein YjbI with pentapeptide repeats